jgi:hypothetical protein
MYMKLILSPEVIYCLIVYNIISLLFTVDVFPYLAVYKYTEGR